MSEIEQVQEVRLDRISTDHTRARFVKKARVMQLADNIEERGLQNPITVRPDVDGSGFLLVSGNHRFAAFVELGRETIPAFVRPMSDEEARLTEVQENLIRQELSVMNRALHMAVEKQIYEARNPGAKHGGDRKSDQVANVVNLIPRRFTEEMADALGCGERDVQRAMQIAKMVAKTPGLQAEISETELENNQHQLLALTKEAPEERLAIVRAMKERGLTKVKDGKRVRLKGDTPKPSEHPQEVWMRKMASLWANADTKRWQDDFLRRIGAVRTGKSPAAPIDDAEA
ncbi:MAG: ParB/RepB/Spo0J family partition protein [Paracoccus sp. (in: a-proteobacteria)]|uniref:ParB/RepB/Spo0J family partition protein n=1 Tax=Paracoccus sp. TaxID=267 RepID=UPI0026E0DDC9|nr:ParB/RepB/Spo0J family partition protein [Paracoccus sp. (in: a-proteobacteria)]MDO5631108.1 ParB/RepB/Spo0J family partition protein [Paracoccus sp. (in: a-proteobacteria)]